MFRHVSRREFLKLAATAGAGLSLRRSPHARSTPTSQFDPPRTSDGVDERAIRDFASGLHGALIRPVDPAYDSARRIWNARFDARPALIVRCADDEDVRRAVQFAQAEKLLVAVRGGGHSMAGHSVCEGGLVIDLSPMKGLHIDADGRTVRCQPGLLASELDEATQKVGLAMVLGGCGTVGIGGFTLGGGEGALSNKYGLGCDNLLSADVLLADGRAVTASSGDHADLLWALRGGGGNFGVVTSFRLRAHALTRVTAGRLIYDIAQAPSVMRAYRRFSPSAPDELTVGLGFTQLPDGPVFLLHAVYAGTEASATPILRGLRQLGRARVDTIALVPYLAFKKANLGPPPGFPTTVGTGFLPDLADELIDGVSEVGARVPPAAEMELFHLHGAVSRVPLPATAFPLRRPGFDCYAIAGWLSASQRDAVVAWVQSFSDLIGRHSSGAYVNMLDETGNNRAKAAYGGHYARLAALKKKYDPNNVFRLNPFLLAGRDVPSA